MNNLLIENFNTTNQSIPNALPHEKLVVYIQENTCGVVQTLNFHERCAHVLSQSDCDVNVGYIHYVRMLYCTLNPQNEVAHFFSVIVLVVLLLIMFLILAETAEKFFCPALTALAKWLKMNESLAGLTLLAFGNGAPDIFTSIASDPDDVDIVFSEVFGCGCLISGLLVGIIILIRPCKVFGPNFLRNVLFYTLGIFLIDLCTKDGYITYIECSGWYMKKMKYNNDGKNIIILAMLGLYFVFIVVVVVDQILVNRSTAEPSVQTIVTDISNLNIATEKGELQIISKKRATISNVVDVSKTRKTIFFGYSRNKHFFAQFLNSLNPIDTNEWNEISIFKKISQILKAPFSVCLTLIIPIVDLEKEAHGWSKLLNMINIILIPQVILIMRSSYFEPRLYLSTWYPLYCLIVSAPLVCFIFFKSRTDCPPFYHLVFCLISIAMSIYMIACVAGEVVNILFTIGMASSCSNSFLAVTLLAAGNSVADILANPSLAKQGYTKMALAACYGGPMFNILTGLTIIYIKTLIKVGSPAKINQGLLGPNAMIFLQIILVMTVFALLCTNFRFRRSIGCFLLILYCLHITYICLGEFQVIHPYGANHES